MNNINILSEEDTGVSLVKVILIFTLFSIYTESPLISHQLRDYINDNRIMRHIIGFITLLVLITMINSTYKMKLTNLQLLVYSLLGYLWFLFSTKMDLHINLIFLMLLLAGYLYETMLKDKDSKIDNDHVLTYDEKQMIAHKNAKKKLYVFGGLLVATGIGAYMYSQKKQMQYGGGYNFMNFLLY